MSPTQRTLKWLRDAGHLAAVVERWNPHTRVRQDLFGCIDILSLHGDHTYAWQVTSSDVSGRLSKMMGLDNIDVIRKGMRTSVVGWRKLKSHRAKQPRAVVMPYDKDPWEFKLPTVREVEMAF